jgi:hypothetical protein
VRIGIDMSLEDLKRVNRLLDLVEYGLNLQKKLFGEENEMLVRSVDELKRYVKEAKGIIKDIIKEATSGWEEEETEEWEEEETF